MKKCSALLILALINVNLSSQEVIKLWPEGRMPNSKGIRTDEIIENERIIQVNTPEIRVFTTSKEENKGTAVVIFPSGGYQRLTHIL